MIWRILSESDPATGLPGARNMAIDEVLLASVEAGRSPPTLRVYGWSPPCISLGHSQDPSRELDLAAVAARGYDVVKRATGGRAVLHIDELTYSIVARADSAAWCASQGLSYRAISQAVAQALSEAGFGLSLDRGYPVEKPQGLRAMTPCFASTARSEVVFGDRKVVGSAQRRTREAFLQHGSILVSRKHRDIVACLKLDAGKRAGYLDILDRNAVSLDIAWDRPVRWQDLSMGFAERIALALGVEGRPMGLNADERDGLKSAEKARALSIVG
ncbi:MAG: lipoate--protein ligase family protein [Fibrobacteres bacterium]|nr:lipoate--protein ligase family protein [Fibrobacterota bacterium]